MDSIKFKSLKLSHPKYRSDIDGLRAIAVISIVFYHYFPNFLIGGFVGVDVFFVISGYLISTIIFENLDKGTFSFSEFYSRRIRRIFPALILVLIACFVFGWFALLADEYKQLGKHIAAGAGLISNFILWNEAGYFDNSAETKPLLHLWSLGIEEQFYIVWPFLLWFAWKRKFNLLTITVVVFFATFILNLNGVKQDMVATFYSPQTRFWELLSGSLLAWFTLYKRAAFTGIKSKIEVWLSRIVYSEKQDGDGKTLANVLSFLGIFLLLYGFCRINKEFSFPGKWALVPVLGAVLIITAGSKAWVNRTILSNKVAVWFGLISFPLYLWHWPLFSFARIMETETPNLSLRIFLLAVSTFFAWLTYKFIEQPIRLAKDMFNTIICFVLMAFICCIGLYGFKENGFPHRVVNSKTIQGNIGFDETVKYTNENHMQCDFKSNEYIIGNYAIGNNISCFRSKPKVNADVLIIGDSHAGHLYIGLAEKLKSKNVVFIGLYGVNGLPYLSNYNYEKVFNYILREKISTVIISNQWTLHELNNNKNNSEVGFFQTISTLAKAGVNIFIVNDVPKFTFEPSRCKLPRFFHSDTHCSEDSKIFFTETKKYFPSLNKAASIGSRITLLDTVSLFCDASVCSMMKDGKLMFADPHHLNILGSRYVAEKLVKNYPQLSDLQ